MTRYNHLLNSHFAGRPLIAQVNDEGHSRVIKVFYIDSLTEVGMFDGVDSWIASSTTSVRTPDLEKAIKYYLEHGEPVFISHRPITSPTKIERRKLNVA